MNRRSASLENGRIALLCPTREKPQLFERLILTLGSTTTLVDLFAYVAWDDAQLEVYQALMGKYPGVGWTFGPQVGFVRGMNGLWKLHPGYALYQLGNDDHECLVQGWDQRYLDEVPEDGVVCVSSLSGLGWTNPDCCHVCALSGPLLDAVGHWGVPGTWHQHADDFAREVTVPLGRFRLLNEVLVAHRHQQHGSVSAVIQSEAKLLQAWRGGPGLPEALDRVRRAISEDA